MRRNRGANVARRLRGAARPCRRQLLDEPRWGTRERLIVDALLRHSEQRLPIPDTGSLRGDLVAFARSLVRHLNSASGRAALRSLAAATTDGEILAARQQFWDRRYEIVRVMLDRAVDRGELRGDVDRRLALEALIGPLHLRALLNDEPIDSRLPERVADLLLEGVIV
jgi:hypothetical protein